MTFQVVVSCSNSTSDIDTEIATTENDIPTNVVDTIELSPHCGSHPETTSGVPHVQIDVQRVPEVHEELIRRVYSIPGIEDRPSAVAGWQGLWLTDEVTIIEPDAVIGERELGHIHDDGSLHIFLEPSRANEAVATCWGIFHPFAVQQRSGWDGFVMLYTPQSINELNVTFLLIVDAYNYVVGANISATDYY